MSREGKRLSGKQWNRPSNEDKISDLDMKRNSKHYHHDRIVDDDDWLGDDLSLPDDFDDDLYFDVDFEDQFDDEINE